MAHLITFEGGEASGKTTAVEAVLVWLKAQGVEAIATREPGGSAGAEQIRQIILQQQGMDAHAELLLFLAARIQHVREFIVPALERGTWVLCDRYTDSTLAYQGGGRGLGVQEVARICENFLPALPVPRRTYLLDMDPAIAASRRNAEQMDRFDLEHSRFQEAVRNAYLELAAEFPERILVLDANRAGADVSGDICNDLQQLL